MNSAKSYEKLKVGDRIKLRKNNVEDAKIIRMERILTEENKGWLVTFNLDEYGETQPYWFLDNELSAAAAAEERRDRSGMPVDCVYKDSNSFDWSLYNADISKQKSIANAFILNFDEFFKEGRGLFICSSTKGSGKTLLSCVLTNEVLKTHDISVKFVNVVDYIETLKSKSEKDKDLIQSYLDCSLLILDDLGTEGTKDWVQSSLFRLIDRRYANMLPTIFTSNYAIDKLPEDDRIINRIISISIPLKLPDQSVRKEIALRSNKKFMKSVGVEI